MVELTVYGADIKCASCINLPSAKETLEWIEAAVSRKYPNESISFRYVDLHAPETESDQKYTEAILNDEYFYPLVVINDEVVGEGNPKLKDIYEKIEANKS